MDRQGPPNRPAISLLGVLIGLDNKKDAMTSHFSRQEGSAQQDWPACVFIMDTYKATFSVIWLASLRRPD